MVTLNVENAPYVLPKLEGPPSIFRQWSENMPEGIEVFALQLPGRENRITEPPFTRLSPLVDAIAKGLDPYFDVLFTFFGHIIGQKLLSDLHANFPGREVFSRRICLFQVASPLIFRNHGLSISCLKIVHLE